MQAARVLEEQMELLEKHRACIEDWSDKQAKDGSAGTGLENLNHFHADAEIQKTLGLIGNWEAAKTRCTELALWLQVGDKPKEGQQPNATNSNATNFLGIVLKVGPAAGRARLRGSACEGTGLRSEWLFCVPPGRSAAPQTSAPVR